MILIITLILALLFLPSPWNLVVIAIAAVLESSLAVFGIRYSRRRRAQVGVQTLLGKLAETIGPLAPTGQVKLDGEIWEAHASSVIEAHVPVRVTRIDGLTLEVEAVPTSPAAMA